MKSTQDKDKTILGLNLKWIWKRFMHVFSGIQALTERLSKIPQQCEIQFRTTSVLLREGPVQRTDFGSLKQHVVSRGSIAAPERGTRFPFCCIILLSFADVLLPGTFRMLTDSHQVKTFFQVGVGRMKNAKGFS